MQRRLPMMASLAMPTMPCRCESRAIPFIVLVLLALMRSGTIAAQRCDDVGCLRTSMDGALGTIVQTYTTPMRLADVFRGGVAGSPAAAGDPIAQLYLTANQDPEGDSPHDLEFTSDGERVLIVNRDTDTVTVFDVATLAIVDTIDVGDFPVDLAITPNGAFAVVANAFGNSVSIIDIAAGSVVAEVPLTGQEPYHVAITSDSTTAIVGLINDATNSSFSLVDIAGGAEVSTFASAPQYVYGGYYTPESALQGSRFTQFALTPNDQTIVLAGPLEDQVSLYDLATGLETPIATVDDPVALDIASDGSFAVVNHQAAVDQITVIDLVAGAISAEFPTSAGLYQDHIAITPDDQYAVVCLLNDVAFIDLATGIETATIATGTPGDLDFTFDGQYLLVPNTNFRVIDVATQTLSASVTFAACAELAVSPVSNRVAALNSRFGENIHLYTIDGASSTFDGYALTGEVEEGDSTRRVAFTPDGARIVAVNNTSETATIYDAATATIVGYAATGARSLDVAITPDASIALVTNGGADTVSVIDIDSATTLVDLPVPSVPTEVRVSPDGQYAYVATVAGTDRIYRIALAGAASAIDASLAVGQMGVIGYTFSVFSDIQLSPDGSVLAVCESFGDQLRLVDTATMSTITSVPVGDFPIRATWLADGSKILVANSFSNDVAIVAYSGATSSVTATATGIDFPLDVVVDSAGDYAYVAQFPFGNSKLRIIDIDAGSVVATIDLPSNPRRLILDDEGDALYVLLNAGTLQQYDALGAATQFAVATPLSGVPSDMAFDPNAQRVAIAQPTPDGIDWLEFEAVAPGGFVRGDVNDDSTVDISDPVFLLASLFVGGSPEPPCADAADTNDDGVGDISDAVYALAALFVPGAPPPPAPAGPTCGADPTGDALECDQYTSCP